MASKKFAAKAHVRRGFLTAYGYHPKNSARSRHQALGRAAEAHGWGTVVKELSFLANINSKEHRPSLHRRYEADKDYAKERELYWEA